MICHGQLASITVCTQINTGGIHMKSAIVKKAEQLYQAGNVQEALHYYASCLWNGEENSADPLATWLRDEHLVDKAGEETVCGFIATILFTIDRCEPPLREHLWSLCHSTFDRITSCRDRHETTDRYVVECNLYRHQHEPQKALDIILEGLARGGTTSRYTFAGLTYLDLEKEEEAERYIALGLKSDPGNAAAYNDLGDYYFRKRRWQKAGECYYKVLEAGDYNDCSWAEPSWIFCCFMADASPYELERLVVYAAADIHNERAQKLCQIAAFELLIPNIDYLDSSSESIVNAARSMREQNNTSGVVRCATTCQESASGINAARLAIEQICGHACSFSITASRMQDPPLDQTLDAEGIILWNYADPSAPAAAVPKPSEYVRNLAGQLAATDFSLKAWYEAARDYAAKLSEKQYHELYGVMVYPPDQTDTQFYAEDWLLRVQFASVCILSQISLHEIDKICKGQLDWPIIPAFTLAAWLASQDCAYTQWAGQLLDLVQSRISRNNYCFFEYAFACAARLLPGQTQEYYARMWQWRQSLAELS